MSADQFIHIRVIRCDGQHEGLTLAGPVVLHPAKDGGMGSIETSTGTSHFFTRDGLYDGWETAVSGLAMEDVGAFAEAIEADRDINSGDPK